MSDEISIHHAPRTAARHRLRPRAWVGLGIAGILSLVGAGVIFALQPLLRPTTPDSMKLMAVTPAPGPGGKFALRLRLQRSDGARLGAAISTTADLVDAKTGKQLLGRQCGFMVQQDPGFRWMDVTLTGPHPPGMTAPRRVTAQVMVQVMPLGEALRMALWLLSGRRLAQPQFAANWQTLAHELVLSAPPTASSTGRE